MNLGAFLRAHHFYESRAAIKAYALLRAGASRVGLQVVLKTFYSPIPELRELPADIFDRRSALPGLRWDTDEQLDFLAGQVETMAEFRPPPSAPGPGGTGGDYAIDNPSYGLIDATVLYGVIRALKPARVVELGSGQSTLVVSQAARANAADGSPAIVEAYDPYPGVVSDGLAGLTRLHRVDVQEVGFDVFESLKAGDVLIVDTTHTVKLGGDANHIVLEILPRLAAGVVVQVHDIFLPYEYPRRFPEKFGLYWGEQYLLHAFLAMNPHYEVLCAVSALCRDRRPELAALVSPGVIETAETHPPGAFWIRRV